MNYWTPSQEWRGEDAYVIGGGDSLRHFDWGLIVDKNTVGCNSAYILGAHIVDILVFGDVNWWDKIGRSGTDSYGGRVVGCIDDRQNLVPCTWLTMMKRKRVGIGVGDTLAWNENTGSLALNLALCLGARRVFLLGFDMQIGKDQDPNWHDVRSEAGSPWVYPRFVDGMAHAARAIPVTYPGVEIVNVTDESRLPFFEKVSLAEHFGGETDVCS